jgi:hypothetical protein
MKFLLQARALMLLSCEAIAIKQYRVQIPIQFVTAAPHTLAGTRRYYPKTFFIFCSNTSMVKGLII